MLGQFPPVFFVGVVVFVIAMAILAHQRQRRRRQEFMALAGRMGLHYTDQVSGETLRRHYAPLELFERGDSRRARHLLTGSINGREVMACAFQYTVRSSGKNNTSTTYHRGMAMLKLDLSVPRVLIRRENWGDKLAGWVGLEDIDFESDQFSREYYVKCADRQFAYKLIDPRMMEFILGEGDLQWEVCDGWVGAWREDELDPDEVADLLTALAGFCKNVPRLVEKEYAP